MRRSKAQDPYAILGEAGRPPRVRTAVLAPLLVLAVFLGLLTYIVVFGEDELADAPPGVSDRLNR